MSKQQYSPDRQAGFMLRMPDAVRSALKERAKANGRPMNAEIVLILEAALAGASVDDERLARIEVKLDSILARKDD